MNSATTNIIVGMIQDFIVTGGGGVVTAMLAQQEVSWPSGPAIGLALLLGAIAAVRRAQSKVDPSVVQRAVRTPEQLSAQTRDREAANAAAVEVALRARGLTDVTPRRVDPEPAPPVITGPGVTRVPRERDLS